MSECNMLKQKEKKKKGGKERKRKREEREGKEGKGRRGRGILPSRLVLHPPRPPHRAGPVGSYKSQGRGSKSPQIFGLTL